MERLPDGRSNPLRYRRPERWQIEFLDALGAHIRDNNERIARGADILPWRSAVSSGHGVGKSALVAWIILFIMSTRLDCRGSVTAGTQEQLEKRTWPELAKWHQPAIHAHWFARDTTTISFALYPESQRENYAFTAATVAEHKTEAFAGLHNEGRAVGIIFDEAARVHPEVWEVADGATTDGEVFFLAFGNRTRATGKFVDCFEKDRDFYTYIRVVDSREVSFTNKTAIQQIIAKYGADSNEAKVRIYGLPPDQEYDGFIAHAEILSAVERELTPDAGAPLILGVDVGRREDSSVLYFRQGRDARSRPPKRFRRLDNVQLSDIIAREADREQPDAIVIEGTGGTGVIDILRTRNYTVTEVYPGAPLSAVENRVYTNRRAAWWGALRDWLGNEGAIPDDAALRSELASVRYGYNTRDQRVRLEAKHALRNRGLPSPDSADALALTFAVRLARRDAHLFRGSQDRRRAHVLNDPLDLKITWA